MAVPARAYLVFNITICLYLIANGNLVKSESISEENPEFTFARPSQEDLYSSNDAVSKEAIFTHLAQKLLKEIDSETMEEVQDNLPAVFNFFCKCLAESENVIEGQELKGIITMLHKQLKTICDNPEQLYPNIPTNFNGLNLEENRQSHFEEFLKAFVKNMDVSSEDVHIFESSNDPFLLLTTEIETNSKFLNFTCVWMEKLTHVFKGEGLKMKINRSYALMKPRCHQLEIKKQRENIITMQAPQPCHCPSKGDTVKFQLVFIVMMNLFNYALS